MVEANCTPDLGLGFTMELLGKEGGRLSHALKGGMSACYATFSKTTMFYIVP